MNANQLRRARVSTIAIRNRVNSRVEDLLTIDMEDAPDMSEDTLIALDALYDELARSVERVAELIAVAHGEQV